METFIDPNDDALLLTCTNIYSDPPPFGFAETRDTGDGCFATTVTAILSGIPAGTYTLTTVATNCTDPDFGTTISSITVLPASDAACR